MYSPAKQRNTPLIAGNVKGKIVSFFSFSKFLFWSVGEKTTVEEY